MRTVLFRHRALHDQNARMLYGTLCVEEARRTEVDQHSTPVQKIYDNGGKDRCYQSCRKSIFIFTCSGAATGFQRTYLSSGLAVIPHKPR